MKSLTIYIYIMVCILFAYRKKCLFYFRRGITMRIIIDTELERIIVPNSFFNQIDKMNKILKDNGAEDKKIDYDDYIKEAIDKALKNAPIRKDDLKTVKK